MRVLERSVDPQTPLDNFKRKTENETCSLDFEETGDLQLMLLTLGSVQDCGARWADGRLRALVSQVFSCIVFWAFFSKSVFHLIRFAHSKI